MSGKKRVPYQSGITLEQAREEMHAARVAFEEANVVESVLLAEYAEDRMTNRELRARVRTTEGFNQALVQELYEEQSCAATSVADNAATAAENDPFNNIDPNMQASELAAILDSLDAGHAATTQPPNIPRPAVNATPRLVLRSFGTQQAVTPGEIRREHKLAVRAERDSRRPAGLAGTHPANYSQSINSGGLVGSQNYAHSTTSQGLSGTHHTNNSRSSNSSEPYGMHEPNYSSPITSGSFGPNNFPDNSDPTNFGGFGGGQRADPGLSITGHAHALGNFPYERRTIQPIPRNSLPNPNYGGPGYFPDPYQNARPAHSRPATSAAGNNVPSSYLNPNSVRVSPRFANEYNSPYTKGSKYFGAKGYPHGRGGYKNGGVGDLIPGTRVRATGPSGVAPPPSCRLQLSQYKESNDGKKPPADNFTNDGKKSQKCRKELHKEYLNPDAYWDWLGKVYLQPDVENPEVLEEENRT